MHSMVQVPTRVMMPSLMALSVQLLGFLVTSLLFKFLVTPNWGLLAPIYFFISSGIFAFAFTFMTPLAIWWRLILLFFPLIVYLFSQWALPSYFFLVGFLFCASLFWSTYKTQVPFYPSGRCAWENVSSYLANEKALNIIDIGSGLGDFSMNLAKRMPLSKVSGIEIAPLPWLISKIRSVLGGSSVQFMLGSYERLDFSKYDIVFAYLSPAVMPSLWRKALLEMPEGSSLISHEFPVPGVECTMVMHSGNRSPDSYVYQIPKK